MQSKTNLSLRQKSPSECIPSNQVPRFVSLGKSHGWDFRVLGKAPMPSRHLRIGSWLLVPAQQDSSSIPIRAYERIQTIFAGGLRPQGFVLVHEAPLVLSAPQQPGEIEKQNSSKESIAKTAGLLGAILTGAGALSAALAVGLGILLLGGVLLIPTLLLAGAVMVDPILVAVTEDGYWIEIDRWNV